MNAAMGASLASGARGTGSGFESDGTDYNRRHLEILTFFPMQEMIMSYWIRKKSVISLQNTLSNPRISLIVAAASLFLEQWHYRTLGLPNHLLRRKNNRLDP